VYLERTSGNQRVDQAGLDSVVEAHPFPPFPSTVTEPYVDVHVDFKGSRRN
jgi:outer membrane biosynthesis protein TonB